ERHLEAGVAAARLAQDPWSLAQALNAAGDVARNRGDHARAATLYEESLDLFRQIQPEPPSVLHNLAYLALHRGHLPRAASLFRESLVRFQSRDERRGIAECLVGLAALVAREGRPQRAARLLGVADAILAKIGATLSPSNRREHAQTLALTEAALDP